MERMDHTLSTGVSGSENFVLGKRHPDDLEVADGQKKKPKRGNSVSDAFEVAVNLLAVAGSQPRWTS